MPITRSAKKAWRSSLKKRVFNSRRKEKIVSSVKAVKKSIAGGDKKASLALMRAAQKALDKAVKHGTLTKNAASRKKSRLAKQIKKLA